MKKLFIATLTFILGIIMGCGNNSIDLSDAFPFLNNDSKAYVKVRKEKGGIGVAPWCLSNVYYSEDDIGNVLNKLNQIATKLKSDMIPVGGSYLEYRFYCDKDTYDSIHIVNGMILYKDSYYKLTNPDISFGNNPNQIHSFVADDFSFKVYKNNEYVFDFNKAGDLEFIKTKEIKKEPICKLKNDFIELFVFSKDEFSMYLKGQNSSYEYYKTVGDVDFSSII